MIKDSLNGIDNHSTQIVIGDAGEPSFSRTTRQEFCEHPLEVSKKALTLFSHG